MKHVFNIESLEAGMVTQVSIKDPQTGVLLVPEGATLTDKYIEILRRRGVKEVEVTFNEVTKKKIQAEKSKPSSLSISPSLMKDICNSLDTIYEEKKPNSESIEDAMEKAGKVVDNALVDTKVTYNLSDFRMNTEPSDHAVRTAAYATAVAKEYNKQFNKIENTKEREDKQIDLEQIAIGALLHDVGKLCSDKEVRTAISKYINLSKNFEGLKNKDVNDLRVSYDQKFVPYYGYNIIHDNRQLPQSSKAMVLLSGEDELGNGPLKAQKFMKIREKDSHIVAAKIINMCSMFDKYLEENMLNNGNIEDVYNQMVVLVASRKINKGLLGILMKAIPLYPVGAKIRVEVNGYSGYGVVVTAHNTVEDYNRPLIKTVPGGKMIDLRRYGNAKVSSIAGDEIGLYTLYGKSSAIMNDKEQELNDMLNDSEMLASRVR